MEGERRRKTATATTAETTFGLASFNDSHHHFENSKEQQEKRQYYPTEQEELRSSRIAIMLENAFWLGMCVFCLWYSDILGETFIDHNATIRWEFVYLAITSFSVFLGIFFYLNYWLVWKGRINVNELNDNWKVIAPKAIPVATFAGLITCGSFIAAYFPLYRWLTFVYFYTFFMALVTVISLFG